jgi:hypothetical protein
VGDWAVKTYKCVHVPQLAVLKDEVTTMDCKIQHWFEDHWQNSSIITGYQSGRLLADLIGGQARSSYFSSWAFCHQW